MDPQNVSFGWNNPLAAYCSQNGYEFTLEYVADYDSGNVYTGVFQAGTQFGMGVLNYTLPFGLQPNAHYVWSIRFANTQNGDLQDFAYLHFRTGPECVSSQLQVPLFHDPVYKTYANTAYTLYLDYPEGDCAPLAFEYQASGNPDMTAPFYNIFRGDESGVGITPFSNEGPLQTVDPDQCYYWRARACQRRFRPLDRNSTDIQR